MSKRPFAVTSTTGPASLPAAWRHDAARFRGYGPSAQADVLEACAVQLEAAIREHDLEALTLEQAENESGYSYSALQKMLASGELENVGGKGKPRVQRKDLPRKARRKRVGLADDILGRRHA